MRLPSVAQTHTHPHRHLFAGRAFALNDFHFDTCVFFFISTFPICLCTHKGYSLDTDRQSGDTGGAKKNVVSLKTHSLRVHQKWIYPQRTRGMCWVASFTFTNSIRLNPSPNINHSTCVEQKKKRNSTHVTGLRCVRYADADAGPSKSANRQTDNLLCI